MGATTHFYIGSTTYFSATMDREFDLGPGFGIENIDQVQQRNEELSK
jgi:hypothetical protein